MRITRGAIAAAAVFVLPLALLQYFAPAYLFRLGFPLDDGWIHAVYARSLALHGTLAYNPGIPANGETSPLWAAVTGWPYFFTAHTAADVALVKITGLLLHAGSAVLAWTVARRLHANEATASVCALLVALHPDLLAASVSGMEVPLATFLSLWAILEGLRGASWRLALVCFLAPLGRPEVASVAVVFLALCLLVEGDLRFLRAAAIALGASLGAFGLMALRNTHITGRPLPATFYAKVGWPGASWIEMQSLGYTQLVGRFAIGWLPWLGVMTALALWVLRRREARAGVTFLTGLAFFSLSFTLIAPVDPAAFYHQRYALPGLPLILVSMPLLIDALLRAVPYSRDLRFPRYAIAAAFGLAIVLAIPARLRHLENDARNIDDVQVAEGKALAGASPATVVWAVDAGAIRYFGNAFVVDAIGLNSPDLLGAHAQTFLDAHRAQYLSLVQGWTRLETSQPQQLEAMVFRPSTLYTVTSMPAMSAHYLTRCAASVRGRYFILRRTFDLACADGDRVDHTRGPAAPRL